ncbi:L,D-transpeptidase [Microbacterium elymi]|uniref:L,D-transpeptidase n=1 Tax=Microbacterium elymi TaxID=2909587 RepID=A0ABY5NKY1_9MICO|nr:L,D-transpeptidase [Microbacterium elymi]UUT35820.1 L,D-transpeptidase [Microbacterium elymi]
MYKLPVAVDKASMTKISRSAVVDLSEQRAYFYQNGKLWRSYLVSTGAAGHATPTGYFRVFAKVPMQDMGCFEGASYCTKNVPWVTYFAPNVGFHGTYWHHNFGHVMSHGLREHDHRRGQVHLRLGAVRHGGHGPAVGRPAARTQPAGRTPNVRGADAAASALSSHLDQLRPSMIRFSVGDGRMTFATSAPSGR